VVRRMGICVSPKIKAFATVFYCAGRLAGKADHHKRGYVDTEESYSPTCVFE
jgi:hypothetical protein